MPAVNTPRPPRERLDTALVRRELVPTRRQAQALISAGLVSVDGEVARSAAQAVAGGTDVKVHGREHPWVGRGGVKLAAALDAFGVTCTGRTALDAGASTGGFIDVLLSRGVARVYAVDVGHGLLDARLRADARVCVMDDTNVRYLESVPDTPPDLITLDLSFISLRTVLPALARLAARPCDFVALFKPQFELGREAVPRGGVVRDEDATRTAVTLLLSWVRDAFGAQVPHEPVPAAITGAKGNQEWFIHMLLPAVAP